MRKESFTQQNKKPKKKANIPKKTNMVALPHYPEFDCESENKAAIGQNMSTD